MRKIFYLLFLFTFVPYSFASEYVIDLNLRDLSLKQYEYTSTVSESERIDFKYASGIKSYFSYFPKRVSAEMPVLVALHGAGRTGSSMVDKWAKSSERHSFVVVAPNGNGNNWNIGTDESGFIMAAVEHALSSRKIKAKKVLLFGHSNGATQAIALAAAHPELFNAVAAHAGTLPTPIGASGNRFHTENVRVALFLGDRDHIFSIASARDTVRWLSSKGAESKLYILKNHGHWYYEDSDRINESAWAFLMSERGQ